MADSLKVLGQSFPSANTLTTLYTVPASASATISSLVACNQGSTTCKMRFAVRPAGAGIASQHYQIYDLTMQPNESRAFVIGITLATTDVLSVQSSNGATSFSAYGVEIT